MNKNNYNPYASALDGLEIEDPVSAFFDFCKERESIRKKRDSGEPYPWSNDSIFQNGRFLNVFREDDRVSKSIINFAENLKDQLPILVQALFLARWCNKEQIIKNLSIDVLNDKTLMKEMMIKQKQWCNYNAYPVESIQWEGKEFSRIDSATELFYDIKEPLSDLICNANGDVIVATQMVNEKFKMGNDFPIFMAIIDIAWFRPDIINPSSPVPTGIGAVAFLDRLQGYLGLSDHQETCEEMINLQKKYWPNSKREFLPIDIEYLSCECRKYYSYVNGTKEFKGKNIFTPLSK